MGDGLSMEDGRMQNLSACSRGRLYVCVFTVLEKDTKGEKSKVVQPGSSLKVGEAERTLENSNVLCGLCLTRYEPTQCCSDLH